MPSALLFHRPARHRQIHASTNVCPSRQLRTAQRRFLRRMRLLPNDRAAWLIPDHADRARTDRARRKRRRRHGRAHAANPETHPDVWADRARSGAPANPVARPMIRVGQLRAVQSAANFHPQGRRRVFILDGARYDALDRRGCVPENSRRAARLRRRSSCSRRGPIPCYPRSARAACNFTSRPWRPRKWKNFWPSAANGKPAERKLAAQLSEGNPGAALALDLAESDRLRRAVLNLIEQADRRPKLPRTSSRAPRSSPSRRRNRLKTFWSCSIVFSPTCSSFPSTRKHSCRAIQTCGASWKTSSKKVDLGWVVRATQRPRPAFRSPATQCGPSIGPGRCGSFDERSLKISPSAIKKSFLNLLKPIAIAQES